MTPGSVPSTERHSAPGSAAHVVPPKSSAVFRLAQRVTTLRLGVEVAINAILLGRYDEALEALRAAQ